MLFAGYGLKCYNCLSFTNWDDCPANKTNAETCDSKEDRCAKAEIDVKKDNTEMKMFVRGCATSDDCKKDCPPQQGYTITKCDHDCCSEDLCNAAKVPMVSAIVLVACALVAFIR